MVPKLDPAKWTPVCVFAQEKKLPSKTRQQAGL